MPTQLIISSGFPSNIVGKPGATTISLPQVKPQFTLILLRQSVHTYRTVAGCIYFPIQSFGYSCNILRMPPNGSIQGCNHILFWLYRLGRESALTRGRPSNCRGPFQDPFRINPIPNYSGGAMPHWVCAPLVVRLLTALLSLMAFPWLLAVITHSPFHISVIEYFRHWK
jgi:hypothetical protein